ncbi:MAG: hypothetical protein IJA40_05810 [Phascolarctobacterium sp.]|nr:hypothetical protein [Phascolarctobacterium sp.]
MYENFKYQPKDFPYPLNEDMERVYDMYLKKDEFYLELAVSDIHLTLKHAAVNRVFSPDKVKEMQIYFWGLLDD